MAGWKETVRHGFTGPAARSLRYPIALGALYAFGYLAVVVVNQGRSLAGTLTVAFFVGCGVTLAAYFWRDRPPIRDKESPQVVPEADPASDAPDGG